MRTIDQFTCLVVFLFSIIFLFSCNQLKKNKSHQHVSDSSIEMGRVLAATHCQYCHMLPDPLSLCSKNWENGVLPAMGPRLGIFNYGFQHYPSSRYDKYLPANFYPAKPVLNSLEWQNIIDYYTSLSPDSLPCQQRYQAIKPGLSLFKVQFPAYSYPSPAICLTKIDTTASVHQLLLFDLMGKYTFRYNNQLLLTDSFKLDATITDIDFHNDTMLACNINVINPNNGKFGKSHYIYTYTKGRMHSDTTAILDSLSRPVKITSCYINNDNKKHYIDLEIGN